MLVFGLGVEELVENCREIVMLVFDLGVEV